MVRDGVGKICGLIRILPIAGAAVTYRENLGKAAGRGSLKYLPISIIINDSFGKLSINHPLYFIMGYRSREVLIGQFSEALSGSFLPK